MNIKCNLKDLINGLNVVSKTNNKTTMPILDGILLEAYQGKLKLITNDLDIGSEHILDCDVIKERSTGAEMKTLNENVRKIEDETTETEEQDSPSI